MNLFSWNRNLIVLNFLSYLLQFPYIFILKQKYFFFENLFTNISQDLIYWYRTCKIFVNSNESKLISLRSWDTLIKLQFKNIIYLYSYIYNLFYIYYIFIKYNFMYIYILISLQNLITELYAENSFFS